MNLIDKLNEAVVSVATEGKYRVVKIYIHKSVVEAILDELKQQSATLIAEPAFMSCPMEVIYGDDAPEWILDLEPLQNKPNVDFEFIGWRFHYGIDKGSPDGDWSAIGGVIYPTS